MPDIYEQHAAAFANVAAYVIMRDGERVATIAFKFSRDGAGRLYAYVHWLGLPMVRGFANGYGYDKRSAACSAAVRKIMVPSGEDHGDVSRFCTALAHDDGAYWDSNLHNAGFIVLQAV